MSYMATLSESQSKAADWVLCTESKELPCHSLLLSSVSSVLSGLQGSKPREVGKIAVPFRGSHHAAEKFLQFCYQCNPGVLSIDESYKLALLSHEWGIQGMPPLLVLLLAVNLTRLQDLIGLETVLELRKAMLLCRPHKAVRRQSCQACLSVFGDAAAQEPGN